MDTQEKEEYKKLYDVFESWQAKMGVIRFRGSKKQKKVAFKRYTALKTKLKNEISEAKRVKIEKLKEQLRKEEYSLEHDFHKFWWEILPLDAHTKCIRRIEELKKQLSDLN